MAAIQLKLTGNITKRLRIVLLTFRRQLCVGIKLSKQIQLCDQEEVLQCILYSIFQLAVTEHIRFYVKIAF